MGRTAAIPAVGQDSALSTDRREPLAPRRFTDNVEGSFVDIFVTALAALGIICRCGFLVVSEFAVLIQMDSWGGRPFNRAIGR